MQTIYFRGTHAQVRHILHSIPRIVAGRVPDPSGVAKGVQLRAATALLSQVQQDFLVKSRGGTGKDRVKWPALAMSTIAARKRTAKEVAEYKKRDKQNKTLGKFTKLAWFGSRAVDMLRDTGRLFRSLTPGVEGRPSGNPDQVITNGPGTLVLASKCPYLETHQKGTKHVPARPVFPVNGRIPDAYVPAVLGAMGRGVVALLAYLLTGRRQ